MSTNNQQHDIRAGLSLLVHQPSLEHDHEEKSQNSPITKKDSTKSDNTSNAKPFGSNKFFMPIKK